MAFAGYESIRSSDSAWRNRHEVLTGRAEIVEFLRLKWRRELDYALRKDLWSFHGNRIFGPRPEEERSHSFPLR